MEEYTDSEKLKLLHYAFENDSINYDVIQREMQMSERKKYLKMHPYKIWKGSDGGYYTYMPDEKRGRVRRKRSTRKDLEDMIIDYWSKERAQITINDVFNEWNDRRLNLGQIEPSTYHRNQVIYTRHFEDFGERNIREVLPEEVEDFLEEQVAKFGLNSKSFSNLKTIVRGFFKRAKKRKLIDWNVEEMLQEMDLSSAMFRKNIKDDSDEVFTDEELPQLISYLINHPDIWNLGILLIMVTGLRVGELSALKWCDILDNERIFVHRTETHYYEDGKPMYKVRDFPKTKAGVRTVIIPEDYCWIIEKLRKINPFGEYVFMRKNKRMKSYAFRDRLYLVCEKLGFSKKSPHKERKTYASILLDHGIDNSLIISQMGHTDISCTENHYHKDRKSFNVKANIINNIEEFQLAK